MKYEFGFHETVETILRYNYAHNLDCISNRKASVYILNRINSRNRITHRYSAKRIY